ARLTDGARASQRKNLVTAAICQDGPVPPHKPMQSPGRFQDIQGWPEIEMISISQDDLSLYVFFELLLADGLHAPCSAYRHNNRRKDLAMMGMNFSSPRR